jgi:hypothetical protein
MPALAVALPACWPAGLRAFSSDVETGSREENATKQKPRASLLMESEAKKL